MFKQVFEKNCSQTLMQSIQLSITANRMFHFQVIDLQFVNLSLRGDKFCSNYFETERRQWKLWTPLLGYKSKLSLINISCFLWTNLDFVLFHPAKTIVWNEPRLWFFFNRCGQSHVKKTEDSCEHWKLRSWFQFQIGIFLALLFQFLLQQNLLNKFTSRRNNSQNILSNERNQ